ncbi:hypothetical protein JCM3765_006216 [Sporobolomyces pararoseus]
MDRAALKTRKVDRLSLLPPELIDYVFELAAATNKLSIVPPSKQLLPSHERALYRSVFLSSQRQLSALIATLETDQRKGLLIKFVECHDSNYYKPKLDMLLVNKLFSSLENLQSLTLDFRYNDWTLRKSLGSGAQLGKLHTLRLPGRMVTPDAVRVLSKIPNLRKIEFSSISQDTGEFDAPAAQVSEIFINCEWTRQNIAVIDATSLLRSFPSAKIVSVEMHLAVRADAIDWPSILTPLESSLHFLRFLDNSSPSTRISLPTISNFTSVRLLQIDLPSTIDSAHLLGLRNLVSLAIVVDRLDRDLVQLFQGTLRLPHLRHVDFIYVPIVTGYSFDLSEPKKLVNGDFTGRGMQQLEQTHSFNQMGDWKLPFGSRVSEGLQFVEGLEATAREAGVIVKSNLDQFKASFQFQLVEFYNRGVGEAYFLKDTALLQEALELAQKHDFNLPSLEIDFEEEEIDPDIHECFEVLVVVESHGRRIKRPAFSIREKINQEDVSEEEELEDEMERRAQEEEEEEDWEEEEWSEESDDDSD